MEHRRQETDLVYLSLTGKARHSQASFIIKNQETVFFSDSERFLTDAGCVLCCVLFVEKLCCAFFCGKAGLCTLLAEKLLESQNNSNIAVKKSSR